MDPDLLATDPRLIGARRARTAAITEDDKATLRAVELELLSRVVPDISRRRRARAGRTRRPRRSITRSCRCCAIPTRTCARIRIRRCRAALFAGPKTRGCRSSARSRFTRRPFGRRPPGMWPSEGSVSDAGVQLDRRRAGCRGSPPTRRSWRARSASRWRPELLYRPYRIGERRDRSVLFRDHALSDLIGFHLPVLGRAVPRRTISSAGSATPGGAMPPPPAGKSPPSR